MSGSNTLEILKSALLLEIRGKAFYEKAAASAGKEDVKDFFNKMAEDEVSHVEILSEQYRAYKKTGKFTPRALDGSQEKVAAAVLTDCRQSDGGGRRGIVDGVDRHRHRRRVTAPIAVADIIGERIYAVEAGGWRVGDRLVDLHHNRSIGRQRPRRYRQAVALRIRIVTQHIDVHRRIFIRAGAVVVCHRRIVDGIDGDGYRAGCGDTAVGNRVAEVYCGIIVGRRRVAPGTVSGPNRITIHYRT